MGAPTINISYLDRNYCVTCFFFVPTTALKFSYLRVLPMFVDLGVQSNIVELDKPEAPNYKHEARMPLNMETSSRLFHR